MKDFKGFPVELSEKDLRPWSQIKQVYIFALALTKVALRSYLIVHKQGYCHLKTP